MTLADKIWAAIQRPSPAVSREEIVRLVEEEPRAQASSWPLCGSAITLEDIDDNIGKEIPAGWLFDPYTRCWHPPFRKPNR